MSYLFPPHLQELADGIAAYVQSYMQEVVACEQSPLSVDYQCMAEDFIDSCVVDIMQIGKAATPPSTLT